MTGFRRSDLPPFSRSLSLCPSSRLRVRLYRLQVRREKSIAILAVVQRHRAMRGNDGGIRYAKESEQCAQIRIPACCAAAAC
jgi:hypothetical protein